MITEIAQKHFQVSSFVLKSVSTKNDLVFSNKVSPNLSICVQDTPAHCMPDETSLDSKDSCDSARMALLRQQVELAEQEMRKDNNVCIKIFIGCCQKCVQSSI